jgi:hypothetical protein
MMHFTSGKLNLIMLFVGMLFVGFMMGETTRDYGQ